MDARASIDALRRHLTWSARARRRAAAREGLPPAWHESPLRQLQRWALDVEGLLDELRERGDAHTLQLLGVGRIIVLFRRSAVRAVISASPEDLGHNNNLASSFVGPNSPLLLNGDPHAQARRRMLPLISGPALRLAGPTMIQVADEWVDSLREGQRVSALSGCNTMTLDVIMRSVFGMRPGQEYRELHDNCRRFLEQESGGAVKVASLVLPPTRVREWVLGRRDPDTAEPLPAAFPPSWWPVPESAKAGRALMGSVLAQVRRRRTTLGDGGQDALAALMRKGEEQGHALSDAEVLDEAVTLLLAGHETTAASLGWMLYRLGLSPEWWTRVRESLRTAFEGDQVDLRAIETNAVLGAVVLESMRLDGLASGMARRALRDTMVDGVLIPKDDVVLACTRGAHFDAERWGDPHVFDPSRMLTQRVEPLDVVSFGGGYRRCTGAAFADFELRMLLARVVWRTTLRTPPECAVPRKQDGAFPAPGNGIWMDVLRVQPAGPAVRPT